MNVEKLAYQTALDQCLTDVPVELNGLVAGFAVSCLPQDFLQHLTEFHAEPCDVFTPEDRALLCRFFEQLWIQLKLQCDEPDFDKTMTVDHHTVQVQWGCWFTLCIELDSNMVHTCNDLSEESMCFNMTDIASIAHQVDTLHRTPSCRQQ